MTQLDDIESKIDTLIELNTNNTESKNIIDKSKYVDGISIDITDHLGVKLQSVDELLQRWHDRGGDSAIIAKKYHVYYCFDHPKYINSTERNLIKSNQKRNWMTSVRNGQIFDSLYHMKDGKIDYNHKNGAKIRGHMVVAYGNLSNIKHKDWEKGFFDMIPVWLEAQMIKELKTINDHKFY